MGMVFQMVNAMVASSSPVKGSGTLQFPNPTPKEKGKEHLYSVDNEVVNDLRRHTRAYVKKIGGLLIIPVFPRRYYRKKYRPIVKDSMLVGDLEELVETAL